MCFFFQLRSASSSLCFVGKVPILGIGNLFATHEKIAGHWISTHPRGCMEIKKQTFFVATSQCSIFSGCLFLQLRFRVEARTLSWELTYPRVISRHFWVDDCPYPVWWNMLDLPPTQDASHHQNLFLFFSRESRTKPSFVTVCQMGGWSKGYVSFLEGISDQNPL